MKQETIGLLDSGVGGLSVLKELYSLMPDKNYVFFGDTKNIPYGTKTKEQIFEYTKNILSYFISRGIKTAVFACNTTSAVAYDDLVKHFKDKIKIYPLIQSAAQSAASNLKAGDCVAILATKATIESGKYNEELKKYNEDIVVKGIECSGFVEIVENRLYDNPESLELIKSKLDIARKNKAKRIILGCTHYPYLVNIFKKIYNCEYFNPACALASAVKNDFRVEPNKKGSFEFLVSKDPIGFMLSAKTFFDIKKAQLLVL